LLVTRGSTVGPDYKTYKEGGAPKTYTKGTRARQLSRVIVRVS